MNKKRVEEINKIYNSNVLAVKKEINQFIEDILAGKKDIQELSDFKIFSNQVKKLKEKYDSLYDAITNEEDEKKLFEFVAPEYDFLLSLMGMINILNRYHFTYSLVATLEEVQKDFEDIKTILRASFLEKKLGEATYSFIKEYSPTKNDIETKSDHYVQEFFSKYATSIRFDEQFVEGMKKEGEVKSYTVEEGNDLQEEVEKVKESVLEAKRNTNFKKDNYFVHDNLQNTSLKIKNQLKEIFSSLDRMCLKLDLELEELKEVAASHEYYANAEVWKSDKKVDYDFYNSLSLQGKKEYLETVLSNIENSKVKSARKGSRKKFKYAGKRYDIPKIYYSHFLEYSALLIEVKKEIRLEEEELTKELLFSSNADSVIAVTEQYIDVDSINKIYEEEKKTSSVEEKLEIYDISPEMEEEYINIFTELEKCKRTMEDMELESSVQLQKGLVSSVLSTNGKSVCILSSQESDYNELKEKYFKLGKQLDAFKQKYEINPLYGKEQEKVRARILNKLSLWKRQQVLEVPAIQEEMKPLKKQLFQLSRDKFFTLYENTKAWFRTNGVSARLSEIYASILMAMENSPALQKFCFTEEEKWAIFVDMQAKMERIPYLFKETFKKASSFAIENIKNNIVVESIKNNIEGTKELDRDFSFEMEQFDKIKRGLASLPSKWNGVVSKIKGIRKPKNKQNIHQKVKLASVGGLAIGLGVTVISGFAIVSNLDKVDAKEESVRIEKEATANNEVSIKSGNNIYHVSHQFGVSEKEESIDTILTFNSQSRKEDVLTFSSSKEIVNSFNTLVKQKEEEKKIEAQENKTKEENQKKTKEDIHIEEQEKAQKNISNVTSLEESVVEEDVIKEGLHLRWGDVVYNMPGSKVYRSFDRAAKENEALTPYCEAESGKEITGIIYSYNGTEIFIGNDNFLYTEDDLTAIENMGAIQIGYRAINKDTGIEEGYFNMSSLDTNKLEERGLGR